MIIPCDQSKFPDKFPENAIIIAGFAFFTLLHDRQTRGADSWAWGKSSHNSEPSSAVLLRRQENHLW